MAIIVHFSPSGLDKSKSDDAIRRLEQAGAGSPPGRLYHCFYDSGGALKVVEVWDSQQSFERFGQTLMPILKRRYSNLCLPYFPILIQGNMKDVMSLSNLSNSATQACPR